MPNNKATCSTPILFCVSFAIAQDRGLSYYPDGSIVTDGPLSPCPAPLTTAVPASNHFHCYTPCAGRTCHHASLCEYQNKRGKRIYRGGCIDSTFSDPACPRLCMNLKGQNETWIWLDKCRNDGDRWRYGSGKGLLADCTTAEQEVAIKFNEIDSAGTTPSAKATYGKTIANNILVAASTTNGESTAIDQETPVSTSTTTDPAKGLPVTAIAETTSPPIFPPPTQNSSSSNTGLPVGAIVGIALGAIVGLVIIGILLGLLRQRTLKNDPHSDDTTGDAAETPRVLYGQSEATSIYGNVYEISSGNTSPRRHMMAYRGAVELDEQGLGGTPTRDGVVGEVRRM